MKLKKLSIILFSTILLQNSASLAGQKDEYFSTQCYNYVKSWLKFRESKIDTKYSYWKLKKHTFDYSGEDSSFYCSLKKYECEAAFTQKIEFYEVLPWGERETHTHTCYFRRNGTVLDDGYMLSGINQSAFNQSPLTAPNSYQVNTYPIRLAYASGAPAAYFVNHVWWTLGCTKAVSKGVHDSPLWHSRFQLFVDSRKAGNKQAEGVLKGLVTEDTLSIEMKGVDVGQFPNFIRLILATNNDWVVPASAEQRRFVVIDASAARMQDTTYFGAIIKQMESGGLEALMHHLQSLDLEGVNLRKIPQTDALADQKLRSLDSVAAWLFSCLNNGGIEEVETSSTTYLRDWPETYGTSNMYNAYIGYCKRVGQNHPVRDTVFGKSLARYLPSISKRRDGGKNRQHVYLLPPLDQARQEFASATKIPSSEWEGDHGFS